MICKLSVKDALHCLRLSFFRLCLCSGRISINSSSVVSLREEIVGEQSIASYCPLQKVFVLWRMAFRLIPVSFVRRLFIKRRFTSGVLLASLPFLGYLLLFSSSETGLSTSVPGKMLSTNIVCDCPCATKQQTQNSTLKPQTEVIVTSTSTFPGERKVEHDSSTSIGSLNAHMWSGICGMNVDILRNWPHFPYFPDQRSFVSEFRRTQVLNMKDNGERIFGFAHPQVSGMYKFAITSDNT